MFDALIAEAADRFGLGGKSRMFLGLLLGMVFNKGTGGLHGLRDRFHQAGLGDVFGSWIGGNVADNVLQPDQFSAVVGNDQVGRMAQRLAVPNSAVTVAGATLLPKLVGLLTRDGTLPTEMPAEAAHLLDAPAPHALHGEPAASVSRTAVPPPASTGMGWMKWLLALIVLAVLFWLMRSCRQQPEVAPLPAPAEPATISQPAAATAQSAARLDMQHAGGKVSVNGQLASDADRTRLWDALVANFGQGNVSGDISVAASTLPAGWMDPLIAALPALKADGLKLGLDGDTLRIDSSGLDDEQRFALSDKLRGLFSGYRISGLWDPAAAALAGLQAGFSGDDLVKALNMMNIYFDTGSASITGDSQETLGSAANAIKAAPTGTRIEVSGHTDNTGDAAANLSLSQQRAAAVVTRLGELGVANGVLSAKGYGQDKPRADNTTEQGRAQNRRIEFSVQP